MKGFGRKGTTQCTSPSFWLCHPWVWSSRCSLLQMCRLLQFKADPPVLWDPDESEVKQLAFKSHCKAKSSLSSAAGCSACTSVGFADHPGTGDPRGRRVHLSKETSVIHVKWPVRAPSHLLAETWNGKHVPWAQGPTGSAPSQEMEWWGMRQTREWAAHMLGCFTMRKASVGWKSWARGLEFIETDWLPVSCWDSIPVAIGMDFSIKQEGIYLYSSVLI